MAAPGPIPAPGPIGSADEDTSFFRWATNITSQVGANWRRGLIWEPSTCTDSHTLTYNECDDCDEDNDGMTPDDDTPLVADTIPDLVCTNRAFAIWTGLKTDDETGVRIKTIDELAEMALESLRQHIPHRMARSLVAPNLNSIATDVTGGTDPVSFARALGLILTNRNSETWFTVPETAVPYLVQERLANLDNMTLLNHPMIAVPTNTAPTAAVATSGFWVYGHGPVEYVLGEPWTMGGEDFGENIREAYAQVDALIRVESCRVYAAAAIDPSC